MYVKAGWLICFVLLASGASAAEPQLDLQNPAIEKLQARMSARAAKISEWKSKGAMAEEMTGLLKQMNVAGQGLGEKKEVRDLIVAENEDRYALFRELVLANSLQFKDLDVIGAAYAKLRRASAKPADLIQNPVNKEFVPKKDLKD